MIQSRLKPSQSPPGKQNVPIIRLMLIIIQAPNGSLESCWGKTCRLVLLFEACRDKAMHGIKLKHCKVTRFAGCKAYPVLISVLELKRRWCSQGTGCFRVPGQLGPCPDFVHIHHSLAVPYNRLEEDTKAKPQWGARKFPEIPHSMGCRGDNRT